MATKREAKEKAQEMLMHGIATVLGYWQEDHGNVEDVQELGLANEEFGRLLRQQADRVAKLFGYDEAWGN